MTFLVNFMFCRLDKFDGFVFVFGVCVCVCVCVWEERGGWGYIRGIWRGACLQDLNWGTYFGAGAYIRGRINGILRYFKQLFLGASRDGFFWLHKSNDMEWNREFLFFKTAHLISIPINLQSEYTAVNVCIQKKILRWSVLQDVFQMLTWARFWRGLCNLDVAQPKFKIPRIFLILVENNLLPFTPKWWEMLRGNLLWDLENGKDKRDNKLKQTLWTI